MNNDSYFDLTNLAKFVHFVDNYILYFKKGIDFIFSPALIAGTAAVVGALAGSGAFARKNQRVRRDASCFGITNPELMFVLAANSDQLGCGQRLVCELEATNDEELSETERLILQLFGYVGAGGGGGRYRI